MPTALTYADEQRRLLDPQTPEGIFNRVLAQTGDAELATKALTEARIQAKLAGLQGTSI